MKNFKTFNTTVAALLVASTLTGCGNKDMWDSEKKFNFALESNNGVVSIVGVDKYYDYEGEQVQISTRDGLIILTSTMNTELIKGLNKESIENYVSLKTDGGEIYFVDEMNGNELVFSDGTRTKG